MHLQEHFLREIVRLRSVARQPPDHAVDEVLVPLDELAERDVIATPTPLDERPFVEIVIRQPY